MIFKLNLKAPEKSRDVRVWIPHPVTDENQIVSHVKIDGNYTFSGVQKEKTFGNLILYAEWKNPGRERILTYSFVVERKEVVKKDFPRRETALDRNLVEPYLVPTSLGPTGGKVKQLAETITENKTTNLAKSRAIYD